jgi:hypothetical protein
MKGRAKARHSGPPGKQEVPRKLLGVFRTAKAGPKIGRNQPCPCGSGRKYKRCCGAPKNLQPQVKAVRAMPTQVIDPPKPLGPDGLPLIVTPGMMDPFHGKAIVTPGEIEDLKRRTEPPKADPKIILAR